MGVKGGDAALVAYRGRKVEEIGCFYACFYRDRVCCIWLRGVLYLIRASLPPTSVLYMVLSDATPPSAARFTNRKQNARCIGSFMDRLYSGVEVMTTLMVLNSYKKSSLSQIQWFESVHLRPPCYIINITPHSSSTGNSSSFHTHDHTTSSYLRFFALATVIHKYTTKL